MTKETKVMGHPDLVRDPDGYIINKDREAFVAYIQRRDQAINQQKEFDEMKERMQRAEALLEKILAAQEVK